MIKQIIFLHFVRIDRLEVILLGKHIDRTGEERLNNQGCLMRIVEYNNYRNIVVKFLDEYKAIIRTRYECFLSGQVKNPYFYKHRIGEENLNTQGCLMKIIEYNNSDDIIVEFQDEYKAKVRATYKWFLSGNIKNPYFPEVYGVGMIGNKYPSVINKKQLKEYRAWCSMLCRCFNEKVKNRHKTYKDVTCCEDWLLYENFYEWLHSQDNFEQWLNNNMWAIDKDILVKGNKLYSPETCCLVPQNVNKLFEKRSLARGNLPIGVRRNGNGFSAVCNNPLMCKNIYLGTYKTIEESFLIYKSYKENIIKQVAQKEFNKGNIIKECHDAMMSYKVEITD